MAASEVPKLAGAAALGSADAYATIAGAMAAKTGSDVGGGEQVQKKSYETHRKQLLEARRANKLQERIARASEANMLQVAVI